MNAPLPNIQTQIAAYFAPVKRKPQVDGEMILTLSGIGLHVHPKVAVGRAPLIAICEDDTELTCGYVYHPAEASKTIGPPEDCYEGSDAFTEIIYAHTARQTTALNDEGDVSMVLPGGFDLSAFLTSDDCRELGERATEELIGTDMRGDQREHYNHRDDYMTPHMRNLEFGGME